MKKIVFALTIFVSLLCTVLLSSICVMAAGKEAERPYAFELDPKTDSEGRLFNDVSVFDFTSKSLGVAYDGDWSGYTMAMAYGKRRIGDNDLYCVTTCGGNYASYVQTYAANSDDLHGSTWVRLYIDTTELVCKGETGVALKLYLAAVQNVSAAAEGSVIPMFLTNGAKGYSRATWENEWEEHTVKNGYVYVDEGFKGYVAFPLSSFEHGEESGKLSLVTIKSFSSATEKGYKYLGRLSVCFDPADKYESGTNIYLDNIAFSKQGELHDHNYTHEGAFAATCNDRSIELFGCRTCGDRYCKYTAEAKGHSFGDFKADKDGISYRICNNCGYVKCDESIRNAPAGNDELVTITFDYGRAGGSAKIKVQKGKVLTHGDIPLRTSFFNRYVFQFNCWTSDEENVKPLDPVGHTATKDMTFYARWIISTYTDKYPAALSVHASAGGPYDPKEGRVLVMGNSNMYLYHGMESAFRSEGITIFNNSIGGSTSHDMLEYFKVCVLNYNPQIIIINVTTNDMAYYSMSERIILENMKELYRMTRELLPDTRLFIVSGNPLPGRTEYYQTIERVNNQMEEFCEANEMVEYVDVYSTVLAYAKRYPTNWDTWTHMDQTALREMFSIIIRAVKPYYSADKVK